MSKSHQREAALFDVAMELPPQERAAYLDQVCGGDAALRQRIEALLKAGESSCAFLDSPADPEVARPTIVLPSSLEKAGDRIDRYKLLEQIGEGGCGVVYMAEQPEPLRRRVALKIIKLGMDTKSVIARFEAERQALAMMDHPNIAKVFDAGATETGRPYFVMELVRGMKITDYSDEKKLSRAPGSICSSRFARHPACAPKGHHSSRHQTLEHSRDRERRHAGAQGDRLRHRQSYQRAATHRQDPLHRL
jgi:hypothetical protein